MPLTYSISDQDNLVVIDVEGSVTAAEVLNISRDILSDRRFRPGMSLMAMCLNVSGAIQVSELRDFAAEAKKHLDRGLRRLAIVTPQSFAYGMSRIFAAYAGFVGVDVSVFRTQEEGFRWLEVSEKKWLE